MRVRRSGLLLSLIGVSDRRTFWKRVRLLTTPSTRKAPGRDGEEGRGSDEDRPDFRVVPVSEKAPILTPSSLFFARREGSYCPTPSDQRGL